MGAGKGGKQHWGAQGPACARRRLNLSPPPPPCAAACLAFRRGFSAEPLEEERCPAVTPAGSPTSLTPVKTEFVLATRSTAEALTPTRPAAPAPELPAPTSGLTGDARSALEALAGQLGAVARGSSLAASLGGSWEEVRGGRGCWVGGGVDRRCLLCPVPA